MKFFVCHEKAVPLPTLTVGYPGFFPRPQAFGMGFPSVLIGA